MSDPVTPNRRSFLASTAASSLVAIGSAATGASATSAERNSAALQTPSPSENPSPLSEAQNMNLRFAPHPGMFKNSAGDDVLDQIRFSNDQGFTAWEHNGMTSESPEMQTKIGELLAELKMEMGVFVAYADFERPTFAVQNKDYREEIVSKIKAAIPVAKRCGAKFVTVVPGTVDQQSIHTESWNRYGGSRLAEGYQTANVIDRLRECADILGPHEITMVLEPLNWFANHGGVFLQRSDQAYAICRAVNHPSCKILFDIYHQQITEGNLIPNIEMSWSEIGYFQAGDNPGRKEPGTGEIHYQNVFQFIADRSAADQRDLIIGMEHGNSQPGKAGEEAVIEAYRAVDAVPTNKN